METENGHDYIIKTASFIRSHEHRIAHVVRPRRPDETTTSVWNWFGSSTGNGAMSSKPVTFTNDPHHLFYLLMRMEALGINVGSLDVRIENLSGWMNNPYVPSMSGKDISDTMSISSLRSAMSSVSMFSLGGGWFRPREAHSVDSELKYLYSVFTKLPALRMQPVKGKLLAELAHDPPSDSAIPMDSFKSLQSLECCDIDPRILMGWDRLSQGLRSLTIKRSGVEDILELLADLVIEDNAMRENGGSTRVLRSKLVHKPYSDTLSSLGSAVESQQHPDISPGRNLPPHAWSFLTHLCLADNNLTFILSFPPLPSLLSLDLSSNLLVSVPPCLSQVPRLKSLNISNNMIDSVLGVYSQITFVESLNISSNRLDSLCGLERLERLSRIDLRDNQIQDPDEVGRLAVLASIKEVWVADNPFTKIFSNWRVRCFDLFAKEQKGISLDGYSPGIMERNQMTYTITTNLNDKPRPQFDSIRAKPVESPSSSVILQSNNTIPNSNHIQDVPTIQTPQKTPQKTDVNGFSSPGQAKRRRKRFVDLGDADNNAQAQEPEDTSPRRMKLHMRYSSEMPSPVKTSKSGIEDSKGTPEGGASLPFSNNFSGMGQASTISKASGKRWSRVSPSTYGEIPDGEKLRKRMEELRNDVGDSWLKVLSQTHLTSPDRKPTIS